MKKALVLCFFHHSGRLPYTANPQTMIFRLHNVLNVIQFIRNPTLNFFWFLWLGSVRLSEFIDWYLSLVLKISQPLILQIFLSTILFPFFMKLWLDACYSFSLYPPWLSSCPSYFPCLLKFDYLWKDLSFVPKCIIFFSKI